MRRMLSLLVLVLSLICAPAFAKLPAAAPPPAKPLDGLWLGPLHVGAVTLRLLFTIRHEGSAWKATLRSLDQSPKDLPVDSVSIDGDKVGLALPALFAHFEGTRVGPDRIEGKWTQGVSSLDLTLARTDRVPTLARPQEPKPPFPYEVVEVSANNPAAQAILACTITRPRRSGRLPAALLITGSGAQDRDEAIFGHKPFAVLADALTRRGLVVMRCDDRGTAGSTGKFAGATTLDFAGDVEAELALLRQRPDVDGAHVGLIGHSEGALIAPIVAARNPGVAFVVLLAGPGVRGDETMRLQQAKLLQLSGASQDELAASLQLSQKLNALVAQSSDEAALPKQLRALWNARPPILHTGGGSNDALFDAQLPMLMSRWYREFLQIDPQSYLRKLKQPVLAVNGERDAQVLPKENLAGIRAALAGNPDATVRELPTLNHLFQSCKTGLPDEYGQLEETFAPAALETIGGWVAQHTGAQP
jgi:pimeloyl-ACP methyl ester carboxylesterase